MKQLFILIFVMVTFQTPVYADYFMPAYWMHQSGKLNQFKDIADNEFLIHNHDSIDFIYSQPGRYFEDGIIWSAYHWEWIYRTPTIFGPVRNSIYQRIPIESIIGEKDGYLVLRKDVYPNEDCNWAPWKKISKIYWSVNDPIKQITHLDCNGFGGENIWVLKGVLSKLENVFWDGSQKTWEGSIIHIVEYESNDGSAIDYYLKLGEGLIRLKLTSKDGYVWLEVGAY